MSSFFSRNWQQKSRPTVDGDEFTSWQRQQKQQPQQQEEEKYTRNMYNNLRTRLNPLNWSEELMSWQRQQQQQQQQQEEEKYTRNMYNNLRTRLNPLNWSEELMSWQQQQQEEEKYTRNMYNNLRTRLNPQNWSEELVSETGSIFIMGSIFGIIEGLLLEGALASNGVHDDTFINRVDRVLSRGVTWGSHYASFWLMMKGVETAINESELGVMATALAAGFSGTVHSNVFGGVLSGLSAGAMIYLRNKYLSWRASRATTD